MNENTLITLKLTVGNINNILAALQELPAKIANPLTNTIINQCNEEIAALQQLEETTKATASEPLSEVDTTVA